MFGNLFHRKPKFEPDTQLYKINLLLEEIKNKNNLPFRVSADVLESLRILSRTKDWHKQLDENTLCEIEKIYNRWQSHTKNNTNDKITTASGGGGFEPREYWEGTLEEYHIAKSKGLIKEGVEVRIVQYSSTRYVMNEDGSIEEFMD